MGASGTATLDFGVFPGSSVATVDVSAAGVVVTSAVEAWIRPVATADHTDADHVAAPMKVVGQYLSNDNIRIYGINTNNVTPPWELQPTGYFNQQPAPMFVGQFSVFWVWN